MTPTHHGPDGRFHNPWPNSEPHDWRALLRWSRERRTQTLAPSPPRGSFPIATPAISHPRAGPTDFTATWIGHATVLLQLGGLNVLTDPVFSQRAFPVQWVGPRRVMDPGLAIDALPPLDVVVLSHNHYDHLDRPAVKRIAQAHPRAAWIVPARPRPRTSGRWGAREIVELDWWQETVVQRPSRHGHAGAALQRPPARRPEPVALVRIRAWRWTGSAPGLPVTRRIIPSSARSARDAVPSTS